MGKKVFTIGMVCLLASVHKIFLLKEMERNEECLVLLKSIQPKIRNPEVQKALLEVQTELSKGCKLS